MEDRVGQSQQCDHHLDFGETILQPEMLESISQMSISTLDDYITPCSSSSEDNSAHIVDQSLSKGQRLFLTPITSVKYESMYKRPRIAQENMYVCCDLSHELALPLMEGDQLWDGQKSDDNSKEEKPITFEPLRSRIVSDYSERARIVATEAERQCAISPLKSPLNRSSRSLSSVFRPRTNTYDSIGEKEQSALEKTPKTKGASLAVSTEYSENYDESSSKFNPPPTPKHYGRSLKAFWNEFQFPRLSRHSPIRRRVEAENSSKIPQEIEDSFCIGSNGRSSPQPMPSMSFMCSRIRQNRARAHRFNLCRNRSRVNVIPLNESKISCYNLVQDSPSSDLSFLPILSSFDNEESTRNNRDCQESITRNVIGNEADQAISLDKHKGKDVSQLIRSRLYRRNKSVVNMTHASKQQTRTFLKERMKVTSLVRKL